MPLSQLLDFMTRKQSVRLVNILAIVLLAGAGVLSFLTVQNVTRIVSDDFNSQQLELARHAAGIIEADFKILQRELVTLGLSPSVQYVEAVSWANRMGISLSTVQEYGVIRIVLIDAAGQMAHSSDHVRGVLVERGSFGDQEFFRWCKAPQNQGKIYMSDVTRRASESAGPESIDVMAIGVYQTSTDEAHPVPTTEFAGVLAFMLDVGALARNVVSPIRSGKSGYGWVIDASGNFLYHAEAEFIGENAFEVRQFKDSQLSFSKINFIQKDKMLQGEEGTSWYISGWHKGEIGTIRKLIAYAPVHLGAANERRIWSVAVVAPMSEVEDAVRSVVVRQSLLQGAIVASAMIVLALFIAMERATLRTLEELVDKKTSDLETYAQRLRESERRYRALIESAEDMIYTLDREGRVLSGNRYYRKITGQSPEQADGRRITEIIRYDDARAVQRAIETVLRTSTTVSQKEHVSIGNKDHYLDTKYKPMMTDTNEVEAVLVISRDVTEHRMIEDQLFHTEKLASLGALSAGVAHEINNPLAVIMGFTEMLLEKAPPESKEREILSTIYRQGDNCQKIVENLLTFARISKKTKTDTDVVKDLERVIDVVKNTLLTRKIELRTSFEEQLPRVRGDGRQLEQVFLNIINNAMAAMEHGGVLTVRATRERRRVRIDFSDTGRGIPPENMGRIFEPFFTTKKVGEGTGLGLSVSYGIVKKFGGDIRVRSWTASGGQASGSTFSVILSAADGDGTESHNG